MTPDEFRIELFQLSHELQLATRDIVAPVCQRHDVTPQQMHVLVALASQPGQTASCLSERAGILRTNFASVCRRLAERGLVERHRGAHDGRVRTLSLTPQGRALLGAIDAEVGARLAPTLAEASADELAQAVAGVRALLSLSKRMAG